MSVPAYPEYKDSGVRWLGKVPAHWEIMRLKNSIADCRNGIWGDEQQGDENDIVCIRVADFIRETGLVDLTSPTYRNVREQDREGRMVVAGDLLLEKSGGGEKQLVGAVVRYTHAEPAICSNFVARAQLAANMSSSFWAYVHAAAYAVRLNYRSIKQTSGIQNLDQGQYFDELAAFPPIDEQAAIAAFLDRETAKIDALVTEQERLIALLKEKRQAVISHAVTKGLNPHAPMKDSGIEWLGEIPTHWEVGPLKRYMEFLDGRRIPLSAEERGGMQGDYPYYGASGIIDYVDDYIFDEPLVLVSEDGANLLMRNYRIAFVAEGKYWVNNHAHIVKPKDGLVSFWADRIEAIDLTPVITGAAQPKLTADALEKLRLAVPPDVTERQEIEAYVEKATADFSPLMQEAQAAITLLQERRAALISAAVTGKIDVRGLVDAPAEREVA